MLTPKQWRDRLLSVIEVIEQSRNDRGYAPTILEIGQSLGFSKTTGYEALTHMKRERLVEWDKNMARTLCVTDTGDLLYEEARNE